MLAALELPRTGWLALVVLGFTSTAVVAVVLADYVRQWRDRNDGGDTD
jgi:hypothetical protein